MGAGLHAVRVEVEGLVQGIGYRPWVHGVATGLGLVGWVRNSGRGVEALLEGNPASVETMLGRLRSDGPPGARIEGVRWEVTLPGGTKGFTVVESQISNAPSAWVPPDRVVCQACLAEVRDPGNRRHRYPFTHCARCGPRYSVIEAMPYDRERTSMRHFPMCSRCRSEFEDPLDRRFHAHAIACPDCGPEVQFVDGSGRIASGPGFAVEAAVRELAAGGIVAVKGLGGFQLMSRWDDAAAIRRLRDGKDRGDKSFAVMFGSLEEIRRVAEVSEAEAGLLNGVEGPIVLLRRKRVEGGAEGRLEWVAPGTGMVGAFLPTTALHHLLLDGVGVPLVATSGNRGGDPLCTTQEEAVERLAGLANGFLVHDRPIIRAVDDSVVRVIAGRPTVLRCARGFAPVTWTADRELPPVLGLGGELKNAIALSAGRRIHLGPHVGDLRNERVHQAFEQMGPSMEALHGVNAGWIAVDLHPDQAATRHAEALESDLHGLDGARPSIRGSAGVNSGRQVRTVQHHVAHVVACMAENRVDAPVLGVCWDGMGYGTDGTLWGGEFLRIEGGAWRRCAHLRPFRLPGGDAAAREPKRSALGLWHAMTGADGELDPVLAGQFAASDLRVLRSALERGVLAPVTSSMGRLFDAVASLLRVRQVNTYEGQAAIELEDVATRGRGSDAEAGPAPLRLPVPMLKGETVDWAPMIRGLIAARDGGVPTAEIAAGFHAALAETVVAVARSEGLADVCLSGGCFQNALLTAFVVERLEADGFRVHRHGMIPPNDGGIALGQVLAASTGLDSLPCASPSPE